MKIIIYKNNKYIKYIFITSNIYYMSLLNNLCLYLFD